MIETAIDAAVILGVYGVILLIAELLWKKKWLRGELGRKFIHIGGATFVAFLPFFVNWQAIQVAALAALLFVVLVYPHRNKVFKALYDVDRLSWGEFFAGAIVLGLALLQPDRLIFCVAILHVALADGFAAVVGTTYGKKNRYKIFGHTKSIAGTATFYFISLLLAVAVILLDHASYDSPALAIILVMPLIATALENVGVYGSDNVLVPIFVFIFLNAMRATG